MLVRPFGCLSKDLDTKSDYLDEFTSKFLFDFEMQPSCCFFRKR